MTAAARGDAGGGAEVAALRSAGPADLKILGRVAAGLRESMRGEPPAPVCTLYGGELDRRTVTPLQHRPVLAAGSCEWCQTPFAPQPDKRHCSPKCRSLNEDYRQRMRRLREWCQGGQLPRYGTRGEACAAAALLRGETAGRYRAFDAPCPFCAGWHIVRKSRRQGHPAAGVRRDVLRGLAAAVSGSAR